MNPKVKEKWIEALESGEYEQGKYSLKEIDREGKNKYCCLGVLCDLAEKEGIIEWGRNQNFFVATSLTNSADKSVSSLPRVVGRWAGLTEDEVEHGNPSIPRGILPKDMPALAVAPVAQEDIGLIFLNDQGVEFKQIAQIIREGL